MSLRWLFVIFFASHIPITVLVDSQAVAPKEWYPPFALKLNRWYLDTYNDPLMTHLPLWFKSLVYSEVLLQLPFFFVGTYAFIAKRNWIRTPALIYSSFVVATMVPILAELAAHRAPGYNPAIVSAFYVPYLLVPLLLLLKLAFGGQPFPAAQKVEPYQHYKWA